MAKTRLLTPKREKIRAFECWRECRYHVRNYTIRINFNVINVFLKYLWHQTLTEIRSFCRQNPTGLQFFDSQHIRIEICTRRYSYIHTYARNVRTYVCTFAFDYSYLKPKIDKIIAQHTAGYIVGIRINTYEIDAYINIKHSRTTKRKLSNNFNKN